MEMPPSAYFRRNVWVTTSGVCADAPLRCALETLGQDRVLFAVDYPFEKPEEAGEWIEAAPLSEAERRAVCFDNAAALLENRPPKIAPIKRDEPQPERTGWMGRLKRTFGARNNQ